MMMYVLVYNVYVYVMTAIGDGDERQHQQTILPVRMFDGKDPPNSKHYVYMRAGNNPGI